MLNKPITAVLCLTFLHLAGGSSARAEDDKRCTPLPPGLVSWWPGDGNANDIVGSNNGLLLGGTIFIPGFVGRCIQFQWFDGLCAGTDA